MRDYSARLFNDVYKRIAADMITAPEVGETRELTNCSFTLQDVNSVFSTVRNPSIKYLCAELVWYLSGSRDMKWISRFASLWKKISDDGITNNSGYGYLIHYKHGFDQLKKMIELLKKDPASRRAVINLNMANVRVIETKDEICTIALQFLVRNGRLDCTAMMRSNDIWTGLPYDVIYFTTLQKIIADELGLPYGTYTHFATSLHMYKKNSPKIRECLGREFEDINKYSIDHQILREKAKELYKIVDPENIIEVFETSGLLRYWGVIRGDNNG